MNDTDIRFGQRRRLLKSLELFDSLVRTRPSSSSILHSRVELITLLRFLFLADSKVRLGLTGTAIQNRDSEFWCILDCKLTLSSYLSSSTISSELGADFVLFSFSKSGCCPDQLGTWKEWNDYITMPIRLACSLSSRLLTIGLVLIFVRSTSGSISRRVAVRAGRGTTPSETAREVNSSEILP